MLVRNITLYYHWLVVRLLKTFKIKDDMCLFTMSHCQKEFENGVE